MLKNLLFNWPVSAAIVAVAALTCPAVQAAPVFTDSFEVDISACSSISLHYCDFVPSQTIGPWAVTAGSVDVLEQAAANPAYSVVAQNGVKSLDLYGFNAGTISTTFATVASQVYQVTFFYSREPDRNGVGSNSPVPSSLSVVAAGGSAQTFSFSGTSTPANMLWTQGLYNFTATGTSTTLSFAALNGVNGGGAMLDNVSVSAVPEPAEWAMLLSGIGLVGWAAKRRRGAPSKPA